MRRRKRSWQAMLSMFLVWQGAHAQSDFYVFGAAGDSDVNIATDLGIWHLHRVADDGSSFTFGGGYQINGHFSLEGAYQNFGSRRGQTECRPDAICTFVITATEADFAALSISIVGSLRINDRLSGFGRLGLTRWKSDVSSAIFDDSGQDLHYGTGLRWSFDEHWNLFAEYTRLDLDLETVGLGIKYDF